MLLPAALALMAIGTALNVYGTHKSQKETKKALRQYQNAVANKVAHDKAALQQLMALQGQLAAERQGSIGAYLTDLRQAYATQPVAEQAALSSALQELGPRMGYGAGYHGGAANQWGQGVDARTDAATRLLAQQLLSQHRLRAIQEQEQYAGYRMAVSDLMRQARYLPIERRMQLAQALRDLDWQKQEAAMQANLNRAQQAGAWYQVLGGIGTQAGGILATLGAARAGNTGETATTTPRS